MNLKDTAKNLRDTLQQGIYMVINPLVRLMIAVGITPNMVTTIGLLGNIAGAVAIILAGYTAGHAAQEPYSLVTLSGALIIGFAVFDMLDGQVARLGNMTSTFGAMYDSVLDRYSELFTLGAIAYYFMEIDWLWAALITYLAIVGSLMVSYVRARAEGLGLACKMGFMQRPERVVVTTLGILATGILGQCGIGWADYVLLGAMALIAVFANMTAFARIAHVKKQLDHNDDIRR